MYLVSGNDRLLRTAAAYPSKINTPIYRRWSKHRVSRLPPRLHLTTFCAPPTALTITQNTQPNRSTTKSQRTFSKIHQLLPLGILIHGTWL